MAAAVASDQEFVAALRDAIGRYFAAVDRWESVYCQYYRLPGGALKPSSDLVAERREFEHRRRDLEELLPRARSLCFKYGQRDVFTGLRYASLGRYAPQQRTDSAIGRAERSAVMACLLELSAACREADAEPPAAIPPPPVRKPSLLDRIVALFW
jgi:hypothetical protein